MVGQLAWEELVQVLEVVLEEVEVVLAAGWCECWLV